jgi:hypothetical protein
MRAESLTQHLAELFQANGKTDGHIYDEANGHPSRLREHALSVSSAWSSTS